jgi:hypothetical protein
MTEAAQRASLDHEQAGLGAGIIHVRAADIGGQHY